MSCDEVADLLDLSPDELGAGERARRAEHLEACDDCRALAGAHALAAAALLASDGGAPEQDASGPRGTDAESLGERPIAPARPASGLRRTHHTDDTPRPSPLVRERLLGAAALLHKQLAEPEPPRAPAAEVRVRLRCTFCHGDLESPRAVYCADCLAPVHAGCFVDHGRCPAPGCGGVRVVEPRAPRAPRPRRSRPLLALLVAASIGAPVAAWSLMGTPAPIVADVVADHDDGPAAAAAVATPVDPAAADAPSPPAPAAEAATPPAAPLRVLYVEGQPRWEYRYLKNALLRDPRFVVQCLLLSADPEYVQESSPGAASLTRLPDGPELDNYDVIVLGDVAEVPEHTPRLYPGAFQTIADVVREGVGLLVIDGERSNRAWSTNPVGSLLPVRFASSGARVLDAGPYPPTRPTPPHEALRLDDDPAADALVWAELPPFYALVPVARTTTDASVLLSARLSSGGERPILAMRREGSAVAWLGVDETWRWRAEVGDRYMARFYGQLLRAIDRARTPSPLVGKLLHRDGRVVRTTVQAIERTPLGWAVLTKDPETNDRASSSLRDVKRFGLAVPRPAPARQALLLHDQSLLRGAVAGGGDEAVSFSCDALGVLSVPFAALRSLVLEAPLGDPGWEPPSLDRVILREGKVQGVITWLDQRGVQVEAGELGRVRVELDQVRRVDWVPLPGTEPPRVAPDDEEPRAIVTFTDGTVLRGVFRGLNAEQLRLHHHVLGERAVPRGLVAVVELE